MIAAPTVLEQSKPQFLIVDDEVAMVRSLELLLRPLGDIYKAYSVPEAEEFLDKKIDCIITDVSMPEASGLTLLEKVRRKSPDTPVVVMTAYSSVPQAVEAMEKGAFKYIVKPFENNEMVKTVKLAIKRKGLTLGETKDLPEGWIANSEAIKLFLSEAEMAAKNDSHLLICGEAGVGKARAARWIHGLSRFSKKEFLNLDARSHEEDSPLWSKTMSKVGTIFVSEIFSLTRRLQDKLMELIREYDVRLIGSSSSSPQFQNLSDYREDLFRLLELHALKMPNLKDRKEDLEGICRYFLEQLASRLHLKKLELHESALKKIETHGVSGNIKELEFILERAVIQSKSTVITEEHIQFHNEDLMSVLPFSIPVEDGWNRLQMFSQALERELMERALVKYPKASNTEIAAILGTTRRILELRMKAYGVRDHG